MSYFCTPLYLAVENGKIALAEWLIASGADINQANHQGETPLYLAVRFDDKKSIQFLIDHGADIHQATHNGDTPLSWAKESGNTALVDLLNPPAQHQKIDEAPLISARMTEHCNALTSDAGVLSNAGVSIQQPLISYEMRLQEDGISRGC